VALFPHRPNYLFPITYNTSPHATASHHAQHKEAKFQLSFKVLLLDQLFRRDAQLYFAYTQLAMWQVYDQSNSAPFRDINFEPEVFLTFDAKYQFGKLVLRQIDYGLNHQSNGVTPPDSRSWNRAYARFLFDSNPFSVAVKPWIRLPENHEDDNPDILDYMGYGEITLFLKRKNHVLSLMLRNNLNIDENKGAFELNYSFPLTRTLTGLAQWFNGYGESLVVYNQPNNRFSIGIALGYQGNG